MAKHNFRTSVRNGDIIQGDTRPGEVVTYRLSAEELAKYGPPAAAKPKMALDVDTWPPKKGGDDKDMAIKMSEREAINMRDTADRLAPVTYQAAKAVQQSEPDQTAVSATTKHCNKCGEDKPMNAFSARGAWCKDCRKAYDAERMHKARQSKKAAQATRAAAGPASAIPAAASPPAVKPSSTVIDYVAQHGMTLEVTGPGTLVIANVYAAVDLLGEDRRYRVTMSVEEA